MKGYSFKSLTNLVLKILGTKVSAGTGLSGGGSLEADRTLSVKYGTTAGTATQGNDSRVVNAASNATVNAKEAALETKKADKATTITAGTGLTGGGTLAANRTLNVSYGTAAGTAAQGNDSRLSNSREWTGATISQAEAEAGTATTRRAFTAQRVRQAIVAWFNGISGALGRTILTRTTAAQVRSDIGLGTAATRNVGTASGQVMEVGAFGLGASRDVRATEQNLTPSDLTDMGTKFGYVASNRGGTNRALRMNNGSYNSIPSNTALSAFNRVEFGQGYISYSWATNKDTWSSWVDLIHTGNLLQSIGTSTTFPMSQKATTDQLATKANTTTQVIAGTGLTGGGNLTANRTISISSGVVPSTATSLGTSNLNSMQTAGYYFQSANANATTARNYPVGMAGTLVVTTAAGVVQEYTTYGPDNRKYTRGFYSSSWSAWREIGAVPSWAAVTSKPATATRWPAFTEVTGRPANYPTTWASVAAKPAQATRWPTKAEVGLGSVANYTVTSSVADASDAKYATAGAVKKAYDRGTQALNQANLSIGVGQTWQNVTASRVSGTTYTNNTGRPIMISVSVGYTNVKGARGHELIVGGRVFAKDTGIGSGTGNNRQMSVIIPQGVSYRVNTETYSIIDYWEELR